MRQCILNGIDSAWQPESLKQEWRYHWMKEFDELRAQLIEEPIIDPELHVEYGPRT